MDLFILCFVTLCLTHYLIIQIKDFGLDIVQSVFNVGLYHQLIDQCSTLCVNYTCRLLKFHIITMKMKMIILQLIVSIQLKVKLNQKEFDFL